MEPEKPEVSEPGKDAKASPSVAAPRALVIVLGGGLILRARVCSLFDEG